MAQKINPKLLRLSKNLKWISRWSIDFNNSNYINLVFNDIFLSYYFLFILKKNKILGTTPKLIRTNKKIILLSNILIFVQNFKFFSKLEEKHKSIKIRKILKLKYKKKKNYLIRKKLRMTKLVVSQYIFYKIKKSIFIFTQNIFLFLNQKKKKNQLMLLLTKVSYKSTFFKYNSYLGYVIKFFLKRKKKIFKFLFLIKRKIKISLKKKRRNKIYILLKFLLGIKIKIFGKINGKNRAKSIMFNQGKLKFNHINTNIEYMCFNIYNIHGMYGVHIWFSISKIKNKRNFKFFLLKFNHLSVINNLKFQIKKEIKFFNKKKIKKNI
jgi:hypothetical protein